MTPLPGVRFVAAQYVHLDIDRPARLSLGAGVESTAQGPVPRPPWRPASADELVALVLDPTRPITREELPGCLCLFVVPVHLRSGFWDQLARAPEPGAVPAEASAPSSRRRPGSLPSSNCRCRQAPSSTWW